MNISFSHVILQIYYVWTRFIKNMPSIDNLDIPLLTIHHAEKITDV